MQTISEAGTNKDSMAAIPAANKSQEAEAKSPPPSWQRFPTADGSYLSPNADQRTPITQGSISNTVAGTRYPADNMQLSTDLSKT